MRASDRAKNLSLHVHPGGKVEVVAPRRTRPTDIEVFVAENRAWIDRARRSLKDELPVDRSLPRQVCLPAIGFTLPVEYGAALGRKKWLETTESLRLSVPVGHRVKCRALLRGWLSSKGREELVPWLRSVSQEIGIDYATTQVRGQKTRWGSCSPRGTISINFCLLFLAPELVRYLFLHELCHRRHFNHSRSYWRLVERFEPDCQALDRRLARAWRDVPVWASGD